MKKKLLAILLAATMVTGLYGCGGSASKTTEDSTGSVAEGSMDYTGGSPWINSNIVSNVESVSDVDLKDNFDLAINGDWVKEHEIKSGESNYTMLVSFGDTLNQRLLELMQTDSESEDHNEKLVTTLYQEFMNWEDRDAEGTEPLMPYLQEIESLQNQEDLEAYFTKTDYKFSNLLMLYPAVAPDDTSLYILGVSSPELFLDDTADYEDLENMSAYSQQTYDCKEEAVETVLTQCGYTEDEVKEIFEGAIQFEKKMAEFCYTNDEVALSETMEQVYKQVYSPQELEKYHWYSLVDEHCKANGMKEIPAVWLDQKEEYYEHLDELLSEDNLELIKDYLLAHTASSAIENLDKETFYKAKDIKNKLNGSEGYREETEYGVDLVSDSLGWPLSKLYCDRYVTAEDKQTIYDLIEEIIDGYKAMLEEEDFLSEATKEKAIEKLDKLRINCMYPDDWSDYNYDDLELSDSYFESMVAIKEYETKKEVEDFNEPVNLDEWADIPIDQNSCYLCTNNSINILPGLLGDVLYNSDMSKEEVYGMAGGVIGHEISHAFDAIGATYDADGNYADWWTSEDKEAFKAMTDELVAYYNDISVWEGLSCNGELNKTEACADMGGMAVLLRLASEDPKFDYQKFFESFAEAWAQNITPETANYYCSYDSHPLNYLRVNVTVAQFQEFYDTFDVKEGDGMYIAPEDRVKIW